MGQPETRKSRGRRSEAMDRHGQEGLAGRSRLLRTWANTDSR